MNKPNILILVAMIAAGVQGCDDGGSPATPAAPCSHCVASLGPDRDNTIYDDPVVAGERSAGDFGHIFAGWTLENSPLNGHPSLERRGLIRFDVDGFVEAGSTIDSVALYLTVTKSNPGAGSRWFKLHRVTAGWGEGASTPSNQGGAGTQATAGDATWLHRFYPDSLWSTAGGDFVAAASGSSQADVPTLRYRWGSTGDMTADVQLWLDEPDSNFGWILIGEMPLAPDVAPSAKRFASRENQDASTRPTLQVYFTRP
jgi:hypothetical protein